MSDSTPRNPSAVTDPRLLPHGGGEITNRATTTDVVFRIDLPPVITPGVYTITTGRGRKVNRFRRSVLELPCEIYDGPFKGARLLHYLNLPERPVKKRGRTQIAPRSKLAKALIVALGRAPLPGEDISQRILEHKMFRAKVKVPERDSRNQPVPAHLRAPVVDELLERLA